MQVVEVSFNILKHFTHFWALKSDTCTYRTFTYINAMYLQGKHSNTHTFNSQLSNVDFWAAEHSTNEPTDSSSYVKHFVWNTPVCNKLFDSKYFYSFKCVFMALFGARIVVKIIKSQEFLLWQWKCASKWNSSLAFYTVNWTSDFVNLRRQYKLPGLWPGGTLQIFFIYQNASGIYRNS